MPAKSATSETSIDGKATPLGLKNFHANVLRLATRWGLIPLLVCFSLPTSMHCVSKSVALTGSPIDLVYDIYIGYEPANDLMGISFFAGDVYVQYALDGADHVISVHGKAGWILWDPTRPLAVSLLDRTVYPTPSKSQGLLYSASEEDFHQASRGSPTHVGILADLIAKDSGYLPARLLRHPENEPSTSRLRSRVGTVITTKAGTSRRKPPTKKKSIGGILSSGGVAKSSTPTTETAADADLEALNARESPLVPNNTCESDGTHGDVVMDELKPTEWDTGMVDIDDNRADEEEGNPSVQPGQLPWGAHRIITRMPWTCNKDAEVTRFMSMAPEASSITRPFPMLVELSAEMEYVDCKIRKALAQGSAVLVHGWKPHQAMKFCTEDVETYRLPIHQTVTWQDAHLRASLFSKNPSERDYTTQLCTGTLAHFVAEADNEDSCLNCPDLPVLIPEVPEFVRMIVDDQLALTAIANKSFEPYGSPSRPHLFAPQFMHFDTWRSCAWDTFTHAGFLTYPHHDSSGLATYMYIRAGTQVWGCIHLDEVNESDRVDIFEKWDKYYEHPMATETYHQNVKVGTVVLKEGSVLIQPPGMNHMVYAPVPTIMCGGHFLSYDTMHLTEVALSFDLGLDRNGQIREKASDPVLPGLQRKVYLMAISLPELVLSRPLFYQRSIIAMAAIVFLHPRCFVVQDKNQILPPPMDAIESEINAERDTAHKIMTNVVCDRWGILNPREELRKDIWRDPGPLVDLTFIAEK
ncbi:hypothetical protein EDD16DRAFT_1721328 [Pisolithus croceorrhizus]|nr:hypothetical protein EDD16DRAFT_1721328 [Pisolithus croceorrhizus]